ncbi:MAG: N-acetylmuramoyl-L-alanine amidase [Planctomycetota bacterium]
MKPGLSALLLLAAVAAGCRSGGGTLEPPPQRPPESLDTFVRAEEVARTFNFTWEHGNGRRMLFSNTSNQVAFAVGMTALEVNGKTVPMDEPVRYVSGSVYLPRQATGLIALHLAREPKVVPAPDASLPRDIIPRVPVRPWKYIVIHHSDTTNGNAAKFDRYHREEKGWENGLGYDFVIGNGTDSGDGEIETGPRWRQQLIGAHAGNKEYNEYGIGVCLVGNFEEGRPSARQTAALKTLTRWLMERYHIPTTHIRRHKDVRDNGITECPGRFFRFREFIDSLE